MPARRDNQLPAALDLGAALGARDAVVQDAHRRRHRFPARAKHPPVERRTIDRIIADAGEDGAAREQLVIVFDLEVAHRGARARLRALSGEALANDRFDGHRRDQRAIVVLCEQMPGALDRSADRIRALGLDEHAAAMLAPLHVVGHPMDWMSKGQQRRHDPPAHQPGQRDQRAMQERG
jgi:hypothetical protein